MSDLDRLLAQLAAQDIKLWVEAGRLRYSAPKGGLSADLRTQLTAHKAALIDLLQTLQQPPQTITRTIPRPDPLPLAYAQQRLWFLAELESSAAYNIPLAVELVGQLDQRALQQTLSEIVRRHESLRTTFASDHGAPYQTIQPAAPFVLPLVDLRSLPPASQHHEVQRFTRQEAITPFDLSRDCLLRGHLLHLAQERFVLLLTLHHIAADGWSLGVFVREWNALYTAFCQHRPSPFPELPIQYADFALWQRAYLQGPVLDEQLAYWRTQLHGAPDLIQLPTDRPRPARQSYQGAHYEFQLDADLAPRLYTLAQQQNATLFMVLLAAFNVLLARYSRQDDIVVGSPIANRTHAELEGLIGFFVNTLVLRTRLDDNPSFTALLAQVRQTTLAAYQHQTLPFEQLVEALDLPRALSHSPLFQVMIMLQNAASDELTLPGLSATMQPIDFPFAKFDLTLTLIEHTAGLSGVFEYATDLFDETTIARMTSHFTVLLAAIVAQPEQAVRCLPMLPAAEYRQIIHEWNNTTVDFGPAQPIHALFEQQSAHTPEASAVVMAGDQRLEIRNWRAEGAQSLTYAELNTRANQLAHHLIGLGVQTGALVAVALERSIELVVSLLAVLKAGGAYLPIDPTYPPERISYMLVDSEATILLTQSHLPLVQGVAQQNQSVVVVDMLTAQLADQPTTNPHTLTSPADLAYVIYTSGSTGRPKGIAITHASVSNFLMSMQQQPGLTPTDRLLALTTISFDIAVLELYLPLVVGATVVLASAEDAMDPTALIGLIQHYRITVAQATPATWTMLTMHPAWGATQPLKILCGGEAFPAHLAQRLLAHSQSVWNMYGPTEATVWVSAGQVTSAEQPIAIAPPIANSTFYILDDARSVTPIGVAGELYIGGVQLARGYLNRPELTAERFIKHPQFGPLYKTGDLCRWLPDGTIEFLGRTDFQVKLRGFRIELGEIENALLTLAGVREAVVLAREDALSSGSDKRLVAYVVGAVTQETLRQELAQRLPDYMLPAAFVLLDAMPLTLNGKLDRRALPAPTFARNPNHIQRPRTLTEQQIAQVWEQTLRLHPISIHDNFFAIGGHSLLAAQLLARLQPLLQQQLPLRTLFTHPTVAQLAAAVQEQHVVTATNSLVVTLQACGQQPPLYCLPGAGGGVLYLQALAQALGEQRPFYALESVGFDGKTAPLKTVQAAAAYQLAQIKQHSLELGERNHPLYLAGHSFGGMVAYELAQQWRKAGGKVGALMILDTGAPTGKTQAMSEVQIILLYERLFLEEFGLKPTLSEALLTPVASEARLLLFKQSLEQAGYLPPHSSLEQIRGILNVAAADGQAAAYLPSDFDRLPIHLFVATDEERSAAATQALIDGWRQYGEVTVHETPGAHTTLLYPPHVQVLAEKVNAVLQGSSESSKP